MLHVCLIKPSNIDIDIAVSSYILRWNSQYFDALFRFSPALVNSIIEINEPLGDAFCYVINNLMTSINDDSNSSNHNWLNLIMSNRMVFEKNNHPHQPYCCLEFLFDCVLVSSKYLFDDLERYYSKLLVLGLQECASIYSCNDVIQTPFCTLINAHHNQNDYYVDDYHHLSLVQIQTMARVFNLHYLYVLLGELIQQKRSVCLKRMRKLYGY